MNSDKMNSEYLDILCRHLREQEFFSISIPVINNNKCYLVNLRSKQSKLIVFLKENHYTIQYTKYDEYELNSITGEKISTILDRVVNEKFCEHRYCFNKPLENFKYCLTCYPIFNGIGEYSDECSICLEKNNTSSIILKCHHKLHQKCLEKWMLIKIKCPLCRQESVLQLDNGFFAVY